LPGKEPELNSHLSHLFQDLLPLLQLPLVTLTRKELKESLQSLMLKNPSNLQMKQLKRPKLDFHMLLLSFNLRTQLPGKELELHSHQCHQFPDLLRQLPLLLEM